MKNSIELHELGGSIPTLEEAATQIYQDIINEAGDDGIGRQDASDQTVERLRYMVDMSMIDLPLDKMLKSAVMSVDDKQGKAADRVLERIARGEHTLELPGDTFLRTVVVLGKGHRKTWRFITGYDLNLMNEERMSQARAQVEASKRFNDMYTSILPTILRYRTVGGAYDAGALSGEVAA